MKWCVRSLDRGAGGRVVGERWCALAPSRQPTRGEPRYRDHEPTACGMVVTFPCGYERREPTCEGCNEADDAHAPGIDEETGPQVA